MLLEHILDYSRDELLTDFGKATLEDRYLKPNEKSPQEGFLRTSTAFASNAAHAERMYGYSSKQWLGYASPVLSNAPVRLKFSENWIDNFKAENFESVLGALPISCFVGYLHDSREGIGFHYYEQLWLASGGGGYKAYWGDLRPVNSTTSTGSKTGGLIPFFHVTDGMIVATHQGNNRRGVYGGSIRDNHPEIVEFIESRKMSGDPNKRSRNIFQTVNVSDAFMYAVIEDAQWALIDHEGNTTKTISARYLWELMLETPFETGCPFIHWIDTSNDKLPSVQRALGLKVNTVNICCMSADQRVVTDRGLVTVAELYKTQEAPKVAGRGVVSQGSPMMLPRPNAPMVKILTAEGFNHKVTPDHRVWVVGKGWVEAQDLNPGDKLELQTQSLFGTEHNPKAFEHGQAFDGTHLPDYLWKADKETITNFTDGLFVASADRTVQGDIKALENLQILIQNAGDYSAVITGTSLCLVDKLTEANFVGLEVLPNEDAYCLTVDSENHAWTVQGMITHNTEITLPTNKDRTAVCCLSSVNMSKYDEWKDDPLFISDCIEFLDNVLQYFIENAIYACTKDYDWDSLRATIREDLLSALTNYENKDSALAEELRKINAYGGEEQFNNLIENMSKNIVERHVMGYKKAVYSAKQERAVGLGVMGLDSYFMDHEIPYESREALNITYEAFKTIKTKAVDASLRLGTERGEAPDMVGTGRRNSHLMAIAPTATNSTIAGGKTPAMEKRFENIYTQKTKSGTFEVVEPALVRVLDRHGINTPETLKSIKDNDGSVQHLAVLTENEKMYLRTAFEVDQMWIVEHAAVAQEFVCQAISVNLFFMPDVPREYVNAVHFHMWKRGLKSRYYVRTKPVKSGDAFADKLIERIQTIDYSKHSTFESCLACEG